MIGDVLMSTILFDLLKSKFPEATLHYLINPYTYPVVENHPNIDEFIFYTTEIEKNYVKLFNFLKDINAQNYDAVIDVYGKLSSKLISFRSGAEIRVAYEKKSTTFIYSHSIKRQTQSKHNTNLAIENRINLLKPLGVSFEKRYPKIYLTKEENQKAITQLASHKIDRNKPLYMISVLGSADQKSYPSDYMATLLNTVIEEQPEAQLLFNYIPSQIKKAQEILEACTTKTTSKIFFDLYGSNLRDFMALTAQCTALIGNEGGAVNIAKALDIPTFIIFSPHLTKENWFHEKDDVKNVAVHLSDFITHDKKDMDAARKEAAPYYLKFKPSFIQPKLITFLNNL